MKNNRQIQIILIVFILLTSVALFYNKKQQSQAAPPFILDPDIILPSFSSYQSTGIHNSAIEAEKEAIDTLSSGLQNFGNQCLNGGLNRVIHWGESWTETERKTEGLYQSRAYIDAFCYDQTFYLPITFTKFATARRGSEETSKTDAIGEAIGFIDAEHRRCPDNRPNTNQFFESTRTYLQTIDMGRVFEGQDNRYLTIAGRWAYCFLKNAVPPIMKMAGATAPILPFTQTTPSGFFSVPSLPSPTPAIFSTPSFRAPSAISPVSVPAPAPVGAPTTPLPVNVYFAPDKSGALISWSYPPRTNGSPTGPVNSFGIEPDTIAAKNWNKEQCAEQFVVQRFVNKGPGEIFGDLAYVKKAKYKDMVRGAVPLDSRTGWYSNFDVQDAFYYSKTEAPAPSPYDPGSILGKNKKIKFNVPLKRYACYPRYSDNSAFWWLSVVADSSVVSNPEFQEISWKEWPAGLSYHQLTGAVNKRVKYLWRPVGSVSSNTFPLDDDQDDDNLSRYYEEIDLRTSSFDSDTDDDGLNDGAELMSFGTDPRISDSDGDTCSDGFEINTNGTDPNNSSDCGMMLP